MELVDFLRARLDEDHVATLYDGRWHDEDCRTIPVDGYSYPCNCGVPDRMRADIAAKRRIVSEATYWIVDARPVSPNARQFAGDALRLLASAYADHPDYDESWRP
jgi:hypothetical protein